MDECLPNIIHLPRREFIDSANFYFISTKFEPLLGPGDSAGPIVPALKKLITGERREKLNK